jgi:surfeit locus 1 family protein
MIPKLVRPRWIATTLLVLAALAVLVRLGVWQLERLDQRRAYNTRVATQMQAEPLDLNTELPSDQALWDAAYRSAVVRGVYDPVGEVILRNQVFNGELGYHLLTPLRIDGSQRVILINRGWIPKDRGPAAERGAYAQVGSVSVRGMLLRPPAESRFGVPDPTLAPGETRLDAWNKINLDRLQAQIDGELLPVYLQEAPEAGENQPPVAELPLIELTEGSHFGYALQWFAFAGVLALGYPFFVRRQLRQGEPEAANREDGK